VLAIAVGAVAFRPTFAAGPEPGAWLETRTREELPVEFSEGSKVVLSADSRVRVASVDLRGARMVLERGTVRASIVHRADTRWAFEAGPFVVQVTGTELSVTWDPSTQRFEVHVDSGSVVVTGPLLESGRSVQRGERCAVAVREAHLEVSRAQPVEDSAPPVDLADLPVLEPSAEPAPTVTWRDLARAGKYSEALAAAERSGLSAIYGSGSSEDLMTLSRAARHAERDDVADQALLRCRERFAGSPQAATAAFLLGRGAAPAAAATWFATYLREQPSGPLAREAAGRLVESYQRAGNVTAARAAARSYLSAFPTGPHATYARSVLEAQGR
jgi:transmembrane sensor